MSKRTEKKSAVTIKSIAEAAAVSRGTVDRALNGRGEVNAEVADRIRALAARMGYRPNRAAKALRFNHTPRTIRALLPLTGSGFFDGVVAGIAEAQAEFADMGIHVRVDRFDPRDQLDLLRLLHALTAEEGETDGLIVTGPDSAEVREALTRVVEAGLPVITVNSDIRVPGRLCFVGQDLERSGVVAAEVMAKILPSRGRVVAVTGNLRFQAHKDRIDGFTRGMHDWSPDCPVEVLEGFDVYEQTHRVLNQAVAGGSDLPVGIYMSTGSVEAMLSVLRAHTSPVRIRVVTNDAVPAVQEGLKSGEIDFSVLQDEHDQGSTPVRLIAEYLLSGTRPDPWLRSPIQIVGATHL